MISILKTNPIRTLTTPTQPVKTDSLEIDYKNVLAKRVNFVFDKNEKIQYEQYKSRLQELASNGQIIFGEDHLDVRDDLLDRLAYELVYLGVETDLNDLQLNWQYSSMIHDGLGGVVQKKEAFDYLAAVNPDKKNDREYYERAMSIECMHVAQFILRDEFGIDADQNEISNFAYKQIFFETAEFLNRRLNDYIEGVEPDLFAKIKVPETGNPGYDKGADLANLILEQMKSWGEVVTRDPAKYFRAYSKIVASADFSGVGSSLHMIDRYFDELSWADDKEVPIAKLERMIEENRHEPLFTEDNVFAINQAIKIAREDFEDKRLQISLYRTAAIPNPLFQQMSQMREQQHITRLLERIAYAFFPENLLGLEREVKEKKGFRQFSI